MRPTSIASIALFALLSLWLAPGFAAEAARQKAAAPERPEWGRLAAKAAEAIVSVKFVLQVKGAKGSDRSSEEEAFCLLVDEGGVVLCPSVFIGLVPAAMRRGMAGFNATPTDFKVLIGEDPEGYEARLLARDTDLELAWLQLKVTGKKFTALNLSARPQPQAGDPVLSLTRAPRYLGRAPVVGENSVGGFATRPRNLLLLGGANMPPGVPVFSRKGELVGVSIAQRGDEGERGAFGQRVPTLVLPVEDLAAATRRAQEPAAGEGSQTASPEGSGAPKQAPGPEGGGGK
jgi:hypothetical protein